MTASPPNQALHLTAAHVGFARVIVLPRRRQVSLVVRTLGAPMTDALCIPELQLCPICRYATLSVPWTNQALDPPLSALPSLYAWRVIGNGIPARHNSLDR